MGNIGGLVAERESVSRLRAGLSEPGQDQGLATTARGSVALGASGGLLEDASLGEGRDWSVAVCGVVDSVGEGGRPAHPADAIATALDTHGIEACRGVYGEFSCLATDGTDLLAFRDHLGAHGLFVGSVEGDTAVMSRPKQVVAALGKRRRANIDALEAGFFSQIEDGQDLPCAVDEVDRVPRGFVIRASAGGWHRLERLWDPTGLVETARLTVDEAREQAWALLTKAVERALDGPTAVTLSGGIDSTLIAAALAANDHAERTGALSAVYPATPSVDESAYIGETTKMLGLPSDTYQPNSSRLSNLDRWVDRCDGPTMGLALGPLESVNEFGRANGYRTLLSGEMGEMVYDAMEHAVGRMLLRGELSTAWKHLAQLSRDDIAWSSLAKMLGASLAPSGPALAYTGRRPKPPPVSWMDPSRMPRLQRRPDLEAPPARRWTDLQLRLALGPSLPGLEMATIIGDTVGVRTRRPLLDRELWEFFLSLPPEVKFPDAWRKSLVRRVLDGRVPHSVARRTDKTYFDEDAELNAEYPELIERLSNGFELPGIYYDRLLERLEERSMRISELARARHLASIHAFVAVTS